MDECSDCWCDDCSKCSYKCSSDSKIVIHLAVEVAEKKKAEYGGSYTIEEITGGAEE